MTGTDSQPIAENEQVKELLALLKDNNTPGYEEFSKLIEHVTDGAASLEATEELKAVRQEMGITEPFSERCSPKELSLWRRYFRYASPSFRTQSQIINGCRNILTDFRERCVALNGITQFLHVRPVLESIQSAAKKYAGQQQGCCQN